MHSDSARPLPHAPIARAGLRTALRRMRTKDFLIGALWSCGLIAATVLHATDRTWDGSSSNAWGTKQNWSGNTTPVGTDSVTFTSSGTTQYSINLGATGRTTLGITFSAATGAQAFTFTNGSFTINGNGIVNNDDAVQNFSATPVTAAAVQTWNAASGGLSFGNVTMTGTTLTLSGTNAISMSGTLLNSGGNRTLTNDNSAVTIAGLKLSESATTGRTFTINGSGDATISGAIVNGATGAGNLTYSGSGSLTLSGNNTYSGITTLSSGTLNLNSSTALGTGTFRIDGGTIDNTSGGAVTLSNNNVQTWNSSFTFTGSNALNLGTGAVTMGAAANVTVDASTLTVGGNVNTAGFALTKLGAGTLTIGGNITNSGSVTVDGGTLTLTNTGNTYSGNTTITSGTLQLGNGSANGTLTGTAAVINNANLAFNQNSTTTFDRNISGAGNVTISGAQTTLSGNNSYSGTTTVNAGGTLGSGSNSAASSNSAFVVNGTWLVGNFTHSIASLAGTNNGASVSIGAAGVLTVGTDSTSTVFAGGVSGAGALTKVGNGTLTLASLNNTYGGNTTISGGTLQFGNGSSNGTLNGAGNVINNANLAFNQNTATTFGRNISGSGNVTVSGAATTFSGTNTYLGITTINSGGTLTNGVVNAVSTSSAVVNNGTWNLNNFSNNVASLSGTTAGAQISLAAGNLTVGSANTSTSYAGNITGTGILTKTGSGTLTLTNTANNYSGNTTISGGTLQLGDGTSNGNLTNTAAVINNANLAFNEASNTTFTRTISGSGNVSVSGPGTAIITGTSNSYAGITTIDSGATLQLGNGTTNGNLTGTSNVANSGTLSFNTASSTTVTFNRSISGSGNILISGAGTTSLTGANSYLGTTTINSGATLTQTGSNQLPSNTAVTNNGTWSLPNFTQTVGSLAGTNASAVTALGSSGALTVGGNGTSTSYAGTFTGSGTASLTKTGAGTMTVSGNSSSYTGAVAVNQGVLKVTSANALGTSSGAGTTVNGGTLELNGTFASNGNGTLSLSGTGNGGAGALVGTGGNITWAGNITIAGDALIKNNAMTGYLDLGTTTTRYSRLGDPSGTPLDPSTLSIGTNTLTVQGGTSAADHVAVYLNSKITGSGNLVVDMTSATDTVQLTANQNTFNGTTTVKGGNLAVTTLYNTYPNDTAHPNYFGLNGNLVIGDGNPGGSSGVNASVTIPANGGGYIYDEVMNFNTLVSLKSDGTLNLGAAQTIGGLTFTGGAVSLGTTGGLYLNGNVTVNASAGNPATITGSGLSTLSLTIHQAAGNITANANRLFTVAGGAGNAGDLIISAKINNGSITKDGAGTMVISGDNSGGYEGTTTVNNGVLWITHNNALGQADATDTTATTVNSGGTLRLTGASTFTGANVTLGSGNITVTSEKLTLNGTGFGNVGALQNLKGNNAWTGQVVVNDARVNSDADTLMLNGSSVTVNTALEVTGAGNVTISADTGGAGTITKNGTGTLILSGTNNYTGNTTINNGILSAQSNTALGGTGAGTVVNSSTVGNVTTAGTLQLSSAAHGNLTSMSAEPLALNGDGYNGMGALNNALGSNIYSGNVSLQSNSLITADASTNLTLSGTVTSADQGLTVGTSTRTGTVTFTGNISTGASVSTAGYLTKEGSGTVAINGTTNRVGQAHLNGGTMTIGSSATLNTAEFNSLTGTTLSIASGGTVNATYTAANTNFSGSMAGSGSFIKNGTGTLTFNSSWSSSNDLTLNAGTMAFNGAVISFDELTITGGTLSLLNSQITANKIYITGDTIIDFNSSGGTFLSSAELIISPNAHIVVNNWVSVANNTTMSTIWYATQQSGGVHSPGGTNTISLPPTQYGTGPLPNITFNNYDGLTTTWVSGTPNGWFNHEIRPTPEPSTYGALFLGGCLGFFGWRRWRRRK